jgi:hypothetical protein
VHVARECLWIITAIQKGGCVLFRVLSLTGIFLLPAVGEIARVGLAGGLSFYAGRMRDAGKYT